MEIKADKKNLNRKLRKRRWDTIFIGTLMSIAFAVILMRFTGYWPCEIVTVLKIEDIVSCSRSPQDNFTTLYAVIQDGLFQIANLAR
jgi:hypothetical protein